MNYETPLDTQSSDPLPDDDAAPGVIARAGAFCRRRPLVVLGVVAALVAALYVLLHSSGPEDPFASPDDSQLPVVSVIAPGAGAVTGRVEATGTLRRRRERPVGSVGRGKRSSGGGYFWRWSRWRRASATAAALHHGLHRMTVSKAINSRGGIVAGFHYRYA